MATIEGKFVGLNGRQKNIEVYEIFYRDYCKFYTRRAVKGYTPLDKWSYGDSEFVHATGYEYYDYVLGCWCVEYEDSTEYQLIKDARVA